MSIWNKLFKFSKQSPSIQQKNLIKIKPINNESIKDLSNIKQFDDVWIEVNNSIYEGWVVDIIDNIASIVYTDSNNKLIDAFFKIERPFNRNFIKQNGITLILNRDLYKDDI